MKNFEAEIDYNGIMYYPATDTRAECWTVDGVPAINETFPTLEAAVARRDELRRLHVQSKNHRRRQRRERATAIGTYGDSRFYGDLEMETR